MENTTRLADLPMSGPGSGTSPENITYNFQAGGGGPGSKPPPGYMPLGKEDMRPAMIPVTNDTTMHPSMSQNNYMPLNVHPNPYGNGQPSLDTIPFPVQDGGSDRDRGRMPQQSTMFESAAPLEYAPSQQHPQTSQLNTSPPQRLPSHDIPMDTTLYAQDEEIKANYIPKPKTTVPVEDYIKKYDDSESATVRDHEIKKYRKDWMESIFHSYQQPLLLIVLYFIFQMHVFSRLMFYYLGKWKILFKEDGALSLYGIVMKSVLFTGTYTGLWYLQQVI